MAASQAGAKSKNKSAGRGAPPKGYKPAKKTNWFAIWVSAAAVVLVVAIAGGVVWMNNVQSAPPVAPAAANVDAQTGAVTFGTGPNTVESYVDFMCPYCNQFEQAEGETIQKLIASNDITLKVTPLPVLDRLSQGTNYSSRSASAFYAVAAADPANAYAFLQALFAKQPAENSAGLTDQQMVQIAKDAGVNVTPELEKDILDQKYMAFAGKQTLPQGATGTPTLVVNGDMVKISYNAQADIVSHLK